MTTQRFSNWVNLRVVAFFGVLATVLGAHAASVTLKWRANTETNLVGYRVYYGTNSGIYFANKFVATGTTNATVTNLLAGKTYYLAVKATNSAGMESGFSTQVSATTPAPANNAPVALAQTITTAEDTAKDITLSGTDVDGDALTYSIASSANYGQLSGTLPNITYTPPANFNGTDWFTYYAFDGKTNSAVVTVTINVTAVNDAPVAIAQSVTTAEDTAKAITLTGTDIDGDALTYTVVTAPTKGTLTGTAPNLVYQPSTNFNGTDSFTFKANDGKVDSVVATVSIAVTAVNDAPIAIAQNVTTPEDTAKTITLTGTDPEGSALTYTVVSQPVNGTLTGSGATRTYTPTANFSGADSFTFKVNDGTLDSSVTTVSITVSPVNDAPVAAAQSVTTAEDTAMGITLAATDLESNPLTYVVVAVPAHGTLSGTAPNLVYLPATNYNGADSFTFKANDGTVDSAIATVSITVTPVNDAPSALAQSISTAEDTAKAIVLSGADVDNNPLTYLVVSAPAHGTLSGTVPNLTYTPAANYSGSDTFTFKVNDGTVDSPVATVSINVTAVNDAPVALAQNVSAAEDTARSITLAGTDVDGDTLTFAVVAAPAHGTLSGTPPNLTYLPATNYNGPDSFTFKANDGAADSTVATVAITVTAVNDAPVALVQATSTVQDIAKTITLSGTDVENDPLTYSVVTGPAHGTLSGTPPSVTYLPTTLYAGADSFTFKVNDGSQDSAPATVSITVGATNHSPVAVAQSVVTDEDTIKSITLSATDVDGNALTYSITAGPAHGSLSGTAPNLTYRPATNYSGADSFSFKANDGTVDSSPATISIVVNPVNDAPVANGSSVTTAEDVAVAVTVNGSDIEGSPLTYSIVTPPAHGTLSGTAPNLTYRPATNYNGTDGFTFKVNDGALDSASAVVAINITSVNDAPVAAAQSVNTPEDTAKAITLSGTDVEGSSLTYTIVTQPAHGKLTGTAPNLTYQPATNYNGLDSFTFKVNDGALDSAPATVAITVSAINDTPVAVEQSVATPEDTAKAITLSGTDSDGDTLSYTVTTPPTHGTLSGTAPNLTYLPATNYNGSDSFWFKVNDGQADSALALVSITVNAVNDPPVADGQSVATAEDTAKAITLTATDVENSPLTFAVVTLPAHGSLSGTAPNLTYTPAANYNGTDSFTFKANDGSADSVVATVAINISAVNDAPVAVAQNLTTAEDSAKAITLTATDVDGDVLSYAIVSGPAHGTLSGVAPSLNYIPDANYNGSDSFTFKANDGTVDSTPAVVSITVTPVNDAPIADAQTIATDRNVAKSFALTGSDVDGDTLTYAVLTQPARGKLSGTAPNLTYTPSNNITGVDMFTFRVNDGKTNSASAVVTINIAQGLNTAPVASAQDSTTPEDTAKAITLSGTDADGDTLTYTVTTLPAHGVLSGTAPNLIYQPATNYNGSDTLWFKANDGQADSALAAVTITVTPVNDAPVAYAQSVATAEDTTKVITLSATDVDIDPLTYTVVTAPLHGTLSGVAPNLTYKPATNYNGTDSFTFKANDGKLDSSTATVSINVTPVNQPPVANSQSVTTAEDAAKAITLAATDIDGDVLSYSVLTKPAHGALTGVGANLTYTPETNYFGSDSFTFKANDGQLDSATATVSITVTPVNDVPVMDQLANITIDQDSSAQTVALSGISPGPNEIQALTITAESSNPSLIPAPRINYSDPSTVGSLTFAPVAGLSGSAVITVTLNDGQAANNIARYTFTIAVNPAAVPLTMDPIPNVATNENAALISVALTGISSSSSVAGASVYSPTAATAPAISIVAQSSNPALVPDPVVEYISPNATGTLRITPVPNVSGKAIIRVTVDDGVNTPLMRSFTVMINEVNAAPTLDTLASLALTNNAGQQTVPLTGITAGPNESQPLTITASSSNPGVIPVPTVNYTSPDGTGSLAFTPVANASGSSLITVTVSDGQPTNGSISRSFTVTVASSSAAPTIALTSPSAGTSFAQLAKVNLAVNVTPNGHTLNKVQYLLDGTSIGESTASPYSISWNATNVGSFSLVARLTYDGSSSVDSAPVAVSVTGLPLPWVLKDIGSTGAAGTANASNQVFTLSGAGQLGGNSDSFAYVEQPLESDGEIKVRILGVGTTGSGPRAGVMIRESLTSGSRFAFLGVGADGMVRWQSRESVSQKTTQSAGGTATSVLWVRLVRSGRTITGYSSADGLNWRRVDSMKASLATSVYVGLAVASGSQGVLNTSTFANPVAVP